MRNPTSVDLPDRLAGTEMSPQRDPLSASPIVQVTSPIVGDVPSEIEAAAERLSDDELNAEARRARTGDFGARDALYVQFRPKIRRFVGRYARRAATGGAWDIEDVSQESFMAFVEVLTSWPGVGDFGHYFLAVFPKRLAGKVRALDGRQPWTRPSGDVELLEDAGQRVDERVALFDLLARLSEQDRGVLTLHVQDDQSLAVVAERLDCPLHEVQKRWRTIRRIAREHLRDRDP